MLKKLYEKTKYEACIFFFLFAQFIVFVPKKENMPIWQLLTYLGDYSRGFMPRFLLGEIISIFSDTVSISLLFTLSCIVCILTSIVIALIGGYLIRHCQNRDAVTVIIAIMVGSPIFMPILASWLGVTDTYLILLTFIAFVLNENKILRFGVPVVMLACTSIHHAYLVLYMVPVAIALLYDMFKNKKYIRDGILCAVTYISLISLGLFCLNTRATNGYSSVDEMIDVMINKTDMPLTKEWLSDIVPNEYLTESDFVLEKITSTMSFSNLLGIVVIFSPLLILFAYGWIKALRKAEDKAEKFTLFLCLIHPLSTVPAYIFGLNWNRWTSAIITSQCLLYLFMLYRKNKSVCETVEKITAFFKKRFIIVVFYIIYVASFAKLLGI